MNVLRRWAAAAVLTVLAAGCGSSPAPVTRSPSTTPPPATTTAPATASATATPSATAPSGHQKVTITPATGLKSGQKVLVQASGFSPAESLVVTQCAAKGAATGPGDCDLNGMESVTSDASGRIKVDLTITKGPFGANNIVCGPTQACLISVTQATPSPTQEADTPITFGLSGHARRDDDQPGHDRDLCRAVRRIGTRMRAAAAAPRNTRPRHLAEVALRHLCFQVLDAASGGVLADLLGLVTLDQIWCLLSGWDPSLTERDLWPLPSWTGSLNLIGAGLLAEARRAGSQVSRRLADSPWVSAADRCSAPRMLC